jgi:Uma2 family endonuclease
MTVAARSIDPETWTKERFLAWSRTKTDDRRYEFDGSFPVAMAPATIGHNDIVFNIRNAVRSKLPPGIGCRSYGPQQPIETVGGALREPDVFIACSSHAGEDVTVAAPVVVFEVLSPGKNNRERDEGIKVDEYESVPSILRYVIVESEIKGVSVFWREPGEREWHQEPLDEGGPLRLPEFGVVMTFDEIYAGLAFN